MSETPVTAETVKEAFPSIVELRATHTSLLTRQRKAMSVTDVADEARLFIRRARLTGVYLDADEQRDAAQGLIDYWSTTLVRASLGVNDSTLAEFDNSFAEKLEEHLCPYVGLTAFRESDSQKFFGRKRAVDAALARLRESHFVGVTGSSGSGKSSIVLAGIIPALKDGAIEGSEQWLYADPVTPGSDPLQSLAGIDALLQAGAGRTLVVIVDQFEELFTLCDDHQVRSSFAGRLVALASGALCRVVITIRSDYEYRLTTIPELQKVYSAGRIAATALDEDELREAIEKPAANIKLKLEPGLTDALIRDVKGEASALPLLQFTLWRLWKDRDRNRLTLAAYKKLGGGLAALERSADEVYRGFTPQSRDTMRRVLLRMVRAAAGAELTSNRVRVGMLVRSIGDDPQRIAEVLGKLEESKLIRRTKGKSGDEDTVEVSHEALIRNWPLLVGWLETKRGALVELRRLEALADEWLRFDRRGGYLDREQVEEAEAWLSSEEARDLSASESLQALVRESRKLVNSQRRVKHFALALVAVLVLAVMYTQWMKLRSERDKAKAEREADKAEIEAKIAAARAEELLGKVNKADYDAMQKYAAELKAEKEKTLQALALVEHRNSELQAALEARDAAEKELVEQKVEATQAVQRAMTPVLNRVITSQSERLLDATRWNLRSMTRPLRLGASIGSAGGATGSLCCAVTDGRTRYALTLPFIVSGKSDRVIQPGPGDGGTARSVIGTFARAGKDDYRSGALVALSPGVTIDSSLWRFGRLSGRTATVRSGDTLRMIARGSGITTGHVVEVRDDEILTDFQAEGGDSGAPVFNENNDLVGILWGSDKVTAIVLPIDPILRELGVKLVP
ncbi:MAG TPA: hypothetical protein VEK11_13065 [Thermoanaerobaculia bacterium]|nr:hypothetical protein [Thermoanaerobaculia bacterium]